MRVWSTPHETILVPSGENWTPVIDWPNFCACAFAFSTLSSSVAAKGRARQLKEDTSGFGFNGSPEFQTLRVWAGSYTPQGNAYSSCSISM